MPLDAARTGCSDENVSHDHRDPSHPVHNIVKHMYFLRQQYPILNDGWFLEQLSNQTRQIQYPGSTNKTTETGIWSVHRDDFDTQKLDTTDDRANQSLWLVYHNENETTSYSFDCSKTESAMMAPFKNGTTVKNLFYPHDEITLIGATNKYNNPSGCVDEMSLKGYEFRAYVPKDQFVSPPPLITKMLPGHDARIKSTVPAGSQESIDIEIHFSSEMDCDSVTGNIVVNSTTEDLRVAFVSSNSINCSLLAHSSDVSHYVAALPSVWSWKARIDNVSNGIHSITVKNATSTDGIPTNSVDRFLFRVGQPDNPMVFPHTANYTRAFIHKKEEGDLFVSQKAAGADRWRYSLNWGSSWSDWQSYKGGNNTIIQQPWSGTNRQKWPDIHIIAQYWSQMAGSSSTIQHADLNRQNDPPRRFPHIFAHGPYNQYGFDAGLKNDFHMDKDGIWKFHFMAEWPDNIQLNVWGINPDGQPDASFVYGDINGDFVLDRLPPSSLSKLAINVTNSPPSPFLAYSIHVNDGTHTYALQAVGSRWVQLALFLLLASVPIITGTLAVYIYMYGFYSVKFNDTGISEKVGLVSLALRTGKRMKLFLNHEESSSELGAALDPTTNLNLSAIPHTERKRTVLIATMEYDIEDWNIKIKIGGLGVMAQLMGKNLEHMNIIWVVPCVGGVNYPLDVAAPSMEVTVLGKQCEVQVQYHQLRNITYVLLDAPIFRGQTKTEPYPPRMDDLDSAIYYSAWNQCIAQTIDRFPVDLYHINDYHGAAAPLYLLSQSTTIPCCLSLHNAEFQGLWPMRTLKERKEVCAVFNLDEGIVQEYVQFGSVFNLLHAGASYLRVHQKGFGAVGVSNKYGKRSWARYSIFWGLSKIGKLPNPDPTDTDVWDKQLPKADNIHVDPNFEAARPELKRQAQQWASLDQRADAELFVFVGRWSTQKGIDLIADIFPSVLEQNPKVQLICVGPVIDLYGRFAALKLDKMMEKYPGRVFSKPEFTALPPYIFSGAEFALIPSRDEPFGLVAVEFGRKGALGVGARVGGLGQMPGWWYTVESTTSSHLLKQFREAITEALSSSTDARAMMRARSAKQRFPVQQWKEDLEKLQNDCIKLHLQVIENRKRSRLRFSTHSTLSVKANDLETGLPALPTMPAWALTDSRPGSARSSLDRQQQLYLNTTNPKITHQSSPRVSSPNPGPPGLARVVSLGKKHGPGHGGVADDDDEHIIPENELELVRCGGDPSHGSPTHLNPKSRHVSRAPSLAQSLVASENDFDPQVLIPPPLNLFQQPDSARSSVLSLGVVVGEKRDYSLQKVNPFFTDSTGEYYNSFEKKLAVLTGKNSENDLCIEEFLVKSEKTWFEKFRDARLGRTPVQSRRGSLSGGFQESAMASRVTLTDYGSTESTDEFLLGADYKPPKGLKK
jgi:alpha-1,3-glucan synthase